MNAYQESPYMEDLLSGLPLIIPASSRSPDPKKNVGREVETATEKDQKKKKWVFGSTDIRCVEDFSLKVSCVFQLFQVPEKDSEVT